MVKWPYVVTGGPCDFHSFKTQGSGCEGGLGGRSILLTVIKRQTYTTVGNLEDQPSSLGLFLFATASTAAIDEPTTWPAKNESCETRAYRFWSRVAGRRHQWMSVAALFLRRELICADFVLPMRS